MLSRSWVTRVVAGGAASLLVSTLGAAAVAPVATASDAAAPAGPALMVVGDSISNPNGERYTAGAPPAGSGKARVWWSSVAAAADLDPSDPDDVAVDAISSTGIGYGGRGSACNRSFQERIGEIRRIAPQHLLVAGGRNDIFQCGQNPPTAAPAAVVVDRIDAYFAELAEVADDVDLARSDVFVTSLWGTKGAYHRARIAPAMARAAARHGFTWIQTPALPARLTLNESGDDDNTHPNAAGTRWLGEYVKSNSRLVAALGGTTVATPPAQSTIRNVSALGYYHRRSESFWNRATSSAQNYVTYRLTHGRPGRYPAGLGSATSTWPAAFLANGGWISAVPKAGAVAWWADAPRGVSARSGPGHVARVERAYETVVDVSEWTGTRFRTVRYRNAELPDVYLNLPWGDGSPYGSLLKASSPRRGEVTVFGYASDSGAYDTGARLKVTVTQNGRAITSGLLGPSRFGFNRTVRLAGLTRGPATVRVYAFNAPRTQGSAYAWIGTKTVRVP